MNAFWGSVTTGAVAGLTGGVVGTLLNGGSISDALKTGAKGALFGAISAGVAYGVAETTSGLFGIGSKTAHSLSLFHTGGRVTATLFKAAAHGISRALITKAQSGRWSSSFWSGFASSVFGVGTKGYGGVTGRTMIMAVVGGTVSKLTGGKFANGAVSGAFVHLFNAEGLTLKQSLSKLWSKITDGTIANDISRGFEGGLNGYRTIRDNSNGNVPLGIRWWLKGTLTVTEMGATAGLSGWKSMAYDMVSGAYFDTFQTSRNALIGYYIKAYTNDLVGVPYYENSLNPYKF